MAFIGTKTLTQLLTGPGEIMRPFDPKKIKNGAYEMSLGAFVFQTDSDPRGVRYLVRGQQIVIKPGQFALLLTTEYVKIPNNKIAFISIKGSIKFKGLVNISGFHVDPGFEGNLLFSVYNAGPSNIILSSGTSYFPIWFSELNESQAYEGNHKNQNRIPDDPVEALSQGDLASPSELSKRIEKSEHLKTKIEWAVLALLGLVIAASVKLWTDHSSLRDAVEFGYKKKVEELASDSIYRGMQQDITKLASDSTYKTMQQQINELASDSTHETTKRGLSKLNSQLDSLKKVIESLSRNKK